MGRNSDTAKDREFHNVVIKYFCQQNGIRIDSAGTRVLTQNISSCLCRIIYVASQIQKKSRRKTLTTSDISKGIELCGFRGYLLFPTDPLISEAYSKVTGKNTDTVCLDLEPAVGLNLVAPPMKKYNLAFEWALVNGESGSTIEKMGSLLPPSKLSKHMDAFKRKYLETDEPSFQEFLSSLAKSSTIQLCCLDYFSYINSEVLHILHDIPANISFLLSRLLRIIYAILQNPTCIPIFYNGYILPPLFSILFSTHLGRSIQDDHWSLRAVAAQCISLMYLRNVRLGGNADEAITQTILSRLKETMLSDAHLFSCLRCIRLIGGDMVIVFIKRYFYPRFVNKLFGINYHVKEELIGILKLVNLSDRRLELDDSIKDLAESIMNAR